MWDGCPFGQEMGYNAFVLWRKPIILVPVCRGMAIPRLIESCVAGVKECGRRPSRCVGQ